MRDFLAALSPAPYVDRLPVYPRTPRRASPLRTFRATSRVSRALHSTSPPLKSLILAGINEFPEESRGITLPCVAAGARNSASWN